MITFEPREDMSSACAGSSDWLQASWQQSGCSVAAMSCTSLHPVHIPWDACGPIAFIFLKLLDAREELVCPFRCGELTAAHDWLCFIGIALCQIDASYMYIHKVVMQPVGLAQVALGGFHVCRVSIFHLQATLHI